MSAKIAFSLLGFAALAPYVRANGDYLLTVYRESGCNKVEGDENSFLELHTFDSSADTCQQGTIIPTDDWEWDETSGQYAGWVDGNGLASECQIRILDQADVEPDRCGVPYVLLDGAKDHNCVKVWFDEVWGHSYCCNDECDGKTDALVARAATTPAGGRGPSSRAAARQHARDLGLTSRDDSCKWEGTGKKKVRSSTPVKLTGDQACHLDAGCPLESTTSVGFEATSTFSVTTSIGASFFEIVSASMELGYEYSWSENQESTVSYKVSQSTGTTGHIEWYGYFYCDTGKFTGNCDSQGFGDMVGSEGENCIPAYLPDGNADGVATFVQTA